MALQELVSYSAQKVTIRALRGNRFKLVVNIKDNSGADYDFTNNTTDSTATDTGYFQVLNNSGTYLQQYYNENGITYTDPITFNIAVEDGKITILSTNEKGFWPNPGKYKYNLFTELNEAGETASKLTYWLYGEFIVVDDNPATNLGGLPSVFVENIDEG